jgi:sugar/nucleoside kinase (ribokinase family)
MARVHVCKVVRGSYRSTSPVWPDDVYPERIGIVLVDSIPPSVDLGRETLEALRMSANKRGVPVVVSSTTPDWWRNSQDEHNQ